MCTELRDSIINLLENGGQINMDADLACYSTHDGYYFVEYFLSEETVQNLNLTPHEKKLLMDEEELVEVFDNSEEAADFYLRLTNGRMIPVPSYCRYRSPTKTLKDKVAEVKVSDKEEYF